MFEERVRELMEYSVDDLDAALGVAKQAAERAEVELAAITAVAQARQAHVDHGHRSMNTYLKGRLNCTSPRARAIRRAAKLANQHPEIADAVAASRVGVGQFDLLARAAGHPRVGERFAEFAPILTDHAERLDYDDFAQAVKHFEVQADPDGAFDDQRFHEDQRTASVTEHNGTIEMHASGGDPIAATEIKTVFDRAFEAEAHKDFETRRQLHGDDALNHPMPRTARQRAFDALHQIFVDSTTAPVDGLRPEPLVNIIIDATTGIEALARHGFLDLDDNHNDNDRGGRDRGDDQAATDPATRRCATTTGTPLHPDVAVRAMVRGSIRRVIVDAHNVVIDHGRKQRLFTGAARDAARLLVVRCGHRGCSIPAEFCDIDHIDGWAADHGETNQVNAFPLCGGTDRWKHRQRLRGRRDHHGRIHLIRPDGTVIKPHGARDPVWAEPDTPFRIISQRTMTWADFTADNRPRPHHSKRRSRGTVDPTTVITVTRADFPTAELGTMTWNVG